MPLPSFTVSAQRRILVFVAVGCAAALVHWLTVVALVNSLHAAPLAANVAGWAVALCVSFAGQAGLTFRDQGAPLARSAPRFLLVSLGGFAVNEASYALLLRFSPWRYDLLLALVLLGVATLTYLLNRHWAFRRS